MPSRLGRLPGTDDAAEVFTLASRLRAATFGVTHSAERAMTEAAADSLGGVAQGTADAALQTMPRTRPRHHWVVRLTHWVNVVALGLMITTGLRIFNAYPAFARRGETFCCYPFEGKPVPDWLTFGGWLAGGRNWHFAAMWLLFANGLVYLGFIYLHGEWRELVPRRGDPRDMWEMVKFYLFVRRDHPHQGKHNALQKTAYFTMPILGLLAVLTGLAIWKPVQFAPLTTALGGYVWARYWHFLVMVGLVVLSIVHVVMVFAVDPYSLKSMITGGYDPTKSPEARNARPFFWRRAVAASPQVDGGAQG